MTEDPTGQRKNLSCLKSQKNRSWLLTSGKINDQDQHSIVSVVSCLLHTDYRRGKSHQVFGYPLLTLILVLLSLNFISITFYKIHSIFFFDSSLLFVCFEWTVLCHWRLFYWLSYNNTLKEIVSTWLRFGRVSLFKSLGLELCPSSVERLYVSSSSQN